MFVASFKKMAIQSKKKKCKQNLQQTSYCI